MKTFLLNLAADLRPPGRTPRHRRSVCKVDLLQLLRPFAAHALEVKERLPPCWLRAAAGQQVRALKVSHNRWPLNGRRAGADARSANIWTSAAAAHCISTTSSSLLSAAAMSSDKWLGDYLLKSAFGDMRIANSVHKSIKSCMH